MNSKLLSRTRDLILLVAIAGCAGAQNRTEATRGPNRVLDDWHDAASKADEARYFEHITDDAVFLGTDATERWTVKEFRDYVHPYFSKGQGWTYVPRDRHVMVSSGGELAWFDERLENETHQDVPRASGIMGVGGWIPPIAGSIGYGVRRHLP